jgi:hypothetical protein
MALNISPLPAEGNVVPPNNAINTDSKHARAFGAHAFAAGYGGR